MVQLQTRRGSDELFQTVAQVRVVDGVFAPDNTEIEGTLCYQFGVADTVMRIYITLDSTTTQSNADRTSLPVNVCNQSNSCESGGVTYSDVPRSSPYYSAVSGLTNLGAVSGYADGTFRPNHAITRGQLAKMAVVAFRMTTVDKIAAHFSDVPASHPLFAYIETAYSRGLVSGYGDGSFRPSEAVTRAQAAKITTLAAGWIFVNPAQASFTDVPVGSPYFAYVETALAHGVISGNGDGTFGPDADATRGQVAQTVMLATSTQEARLPNGGADNAPTSDR